LSVLSPPVYLSSEISSTLFSNIGKNSASDRWQFSSTAQPPVSKQLEIVLSASGP